MPFLKPVVVALSLLAVLLSSPASAQICTADVRVCPDGSVVQRNPDLNCQFDPCPDAQPVSEPASVPLVVGSLVALLWLRRRSVR